MPLQISPFQLPNRPTLTPQNLAALPKMGPPDMVEANMKGIAGMGTAFEGAYERARERGAMDQLSEYYKSHPFAQGAAGAPGVAGNPAADQPAAGATPVSYKGKPEDGLRVYQGLVDRGIEPHVAAGMAGNVYTESRFNSGAQGDRDRQTGQPTALGYAQWRGSRQQGLFQAAQARGTDWRDPEAQLDHMAAELKGPYAKVYAAAVASGNPGAATAILARGYERPAEWALRKTLGERTGAAQSIFALGQQGGGGGGPPPAAAAGAQPMPPPRPAAAAPPPVVGGSVSAPPPVGLPPPDPTPDNVANAKAIMQQPTSDPRLKDWAGQVLRQQPGAAGQVPTASAPAPGANPAGSAGSGPPGSFTIPSTGEQVPVGTGPDRLNAQPGGPAGGGPAATGSVPPPAVTPPLPPPDPRRVAAAAPGAVPSADDPIVAKANAEVPASVVQNVRQRFNQASPEERAQMIGPNANPLGKAIIQNPAIRGTQGTAYDKQHPASYDPSGAGGLDIKLRPTPSGAVVSTPQGHVFMPNEALAIAARGNPQVFAAMLREYGPNGAGNKGFGFTEVGGVLYRTDPQGGTATPITAPQTGGGERLLPPGDPERANHGIDPADTRTYKIGTDARGRPTIDPVAAPPAPATVDAPGGGKLVWNPQTAKYEPLVIPGQDGKAPMFNGNSVEGQALNYLVQNGKLTPAEAADIATGKTVTHPDGSVYFFRGSELIQAGGGAAVVPGGGPAPAAAPAGGGPAPAAVPPAGGQPGVPAAVPGGPAPAQPGPAQPAPAQPAPAAAPPGRGTQLVPPRDLPTLNPDTAGRMALGQTFLEAYLEPTKKIIGSGWLSSPLGRAALQGGIGEAGQVQRWVDEGSEGLVRLLTGAGMPETEAARYRARYMPSPLDSQKTMIAKVDQLERILRRTNAVVAIGHRKMTSDELDEVRASDREFGRTHLGEHVTPGGAVIEEVR